MDRKALFEEMLQKVDADRRDEAYARLAAVETRAEKIAIFEDYGIKVPAADDPFPEGWAESARALSDEELDQVAGGGDWERDCNCEP